MADISEATTNPATTTPTADAPEAGPSQKRRRVPVLPQDDVPTSAFARSNADRLAKALERARACARIADDNRAKDILLLDLRAATPLIDYFVIASANSRRQAYAIASEIDQEMKKIGEAKLGIEGAEEGRWILVDYGDFVVHVFAEDARNYYALEEIWGDAPRLEWREPGRKAPAPTPEPEIEAEIEAEAEADPDSEPIGDDDSTDFEA